MLNLCLLPHGSQTAASSDPILSFSPYFSFFLITAAYNKRGVFFIFIFVYIHFFLLFLAIPSGVYIPWWREDITLVLFFLYICMCWNTE